MRANLHAPKKVDIKHEPVEISPHEFVKDHKHRDIRELQGKIQLRTDYNYKKLRSR